MIIDILFGLVLIATGLMILKEEHSNPENSVLDVLRKKWYIVLAMIAVVIATLVFI